MHAGDQTPKRFQGLQDRCYRCFLLQSYNYMQCPADPAGLQIWRCVRIGLLSHGGSIGAGDPGQQLCPVQSQADFCRGFNLGTGRLACRGHGVAHGLYRDLHTHVTINKSCSLIWTRSLLTLSNRVCAWRSRRCGQAPPRCQWLADLSQTLSLDADSNCRRTAKP
jgi:hypothetical protein